MPWCFLRPDVAADSEANVSVPLHSEDAKVTSVAPSALTR